MTLKFHKSVLFLLLPLIFIMGTYPFTFGKEKEEGYEERMPSEERMREWWESAPYNEYTEGGGERGERSLGDRIRAFLRDLFYVPAKGEVKARRYLSYLIIGVALVLVARYLWKNGAMALFRRSPHKEQDREYRSFFKESLKSDPQEQARSAEEKGELLEALRWRYVYIVRMLGEQGLIRERSHRTDREYIKELKGTGLEDPFERASYFFQLFHYGERPLSYERYRELKSRFQDLEERIHGHVKGV